MTVKTYAAAGTMVLLIANVPGRSPAVSAGAQGAAAPDLGPVTTITVPDATSTFALDINASGVIVGRYVASGQTHGFERLASGDIVTIDVPGSSFTVAAGINDAGTIVGQYALPAAPTERHGFVLRDGVFTFFD